MGLFGKKAPAGPPAGTVFEGMVVYCYEPAMVSWPGHYAYVNEAPTFEVEWSEDQNAWVVK